MSIYGFDNYHHEMLYYSERARSRISETQQDAIDFFVNQDNKRKIASKKKKIISLELCIDRAKHRSDQLKNWEKKVARGYPAHRDYAKYRNSLSKILDNKAVEAMGAIKVLNRMLQDDLLDK